MEHRLKQVTTIDEDPAHRGDLFSLIKPPNLTPSEKILLSNHAYIYKGSRGDTEFDLNITRALPEGISLAIADAECDAMMGVFAEINRVWVIVDNLLFLWDYTQPGNAYETYFNKKNDQLLVSICLCKPKAGFSTPQPDYLVVLTTFIDVTILRVDLAVSSKLVLKEVDGLVATLDGKSIRCVAGTLDGRIFLGGMDGEVFEFVYEVKKTMLHSLGFKRQCFLQSNGHGAGLSWLMPPLLVQVMQRTGISSPPDSLVKLWVDEDKKLLYALSALNKLFLFDCRDIHLVFVSMFDFHALEKCTEQKSVELMGVKDLHLRDFHVLNVQCVSRGCIHLIVTGRNGIRVFFTTCESVSSSNSKSGKTLNPILIRGPPDGKRMEKDGFAFVPAFHALPQPLWFAFSDGDISVMDSLLLSTDWSTAGTGNWQANKGWRETIQRRSEEEGIVDLVRVKKPSAPGNALVSQYSDSPAQYWMLTKRAMYQLTKQRPLDVLRFRLNQATNASAGESVAKALMTQYGMDEGFTMLLQLASESSTLTTQYNPLHQNDWEFSQLSIKAGHLFSSLGFSDGANNRLPCWKSDLKEEHVDIFSVPLPPVVVAGGGAAAAQASEEPGVDPNRAVVLRTLNTEDTAATTTRKKLEDMEPLVQFSPSFHALFILSNRLLRPFWEMSLLREAKKFRFSSRELEAKLLPPLLNLVEFMKTKHPFSQATMATMASNASSRWTPQQVEEACIHELFLLLVKTTQALKLLTKISVIPSQFPVDMTFRMFVSDQEAGQGAARLLIDTLDSQEWKKLDCALYFPPSHFQFLHGLEQLVDLKSNKLLDPSFRNAKVQIALEEISASLKHLGKNAPDLTLARVKEVSTLLLEFPAKGEEIVRLCHSVSFTLTSKSKQEECFAICFDLLSHKFSLPDQKRAWEVLLSLQEGGESMAQYFFAKWIASNQLDLLFAFPSSNSNAWLESFLRNPDKNKFGDHEQSHLFLLAKYLVLNGRMTEAFECFCTLARINCTEPKKNPSLELRLQYLNSALMLNATPALRREFALHKARMHVFSCLQTTAVVVDETDLVRLQYCPISETELLNHFASKYELWEECIAIIQVFGRELPEALDMLTHLYSALLDKYYNQPGQEDLENLSRVVSSLSRRFGRDALIFPVRELVELLEVATCDVLPKDENWLAKSLLEGGELEYEAVFAAYVRLAYSLEDEAMFMTCLRILFFVVQEWKSYRVESLANKVMHPLSPPNQDLVGVGPTLFQLVNQLKVHNKEDFSQKLKDLHLGELVKKPEVLLT